MAVDPRVEAGPLDTSGRELSARAIRRTRIFPGGAEGHPRGPIRHLFTARAANTNGWATRPARQGRRQIADHQHGDRPDPRPPSPVRLICASEDVPGNTRLRSWRANRKRADQRMSIAIAVFRGPWLGVPVRSRPAGPFYGGGGNARVVGLLAPVTRVGCSPGGTAGVSQGWDRT